MTLRPCLADAQLQQSDRTASRERDTHDPPDAPPELPIEVTARLVLWLGAIGITA